MPARTALSQSPASKAHLIHWAHPNTQSGDAGRTRLPKTTLRKQWAEVMDGARSAMQQTQLSGSARAP